MAIAFDAATDGGVFVTSSPKTFSHTCTGANRILFVFAGGDSAGDNITGVTYAGVAMTLINKVQTPGDRYTYLFYLVGPASGANTVSITCSAPLNGFGGHASSFTGASQTGVPDSSNTGTGTTTNTLTVSTTTVADNCWLVGVGGYSSGTPSAGTGTTQRTFRSGITALDSNGAKTPAGSFSLVQNSSASTSLSIAMASFAPAVAGKKGNATAGNYGLGIGFSMSV